MTFVLHTLVTFASSSFRPWLKRRILPYLSTRTTAAACRRRLATQQSALSMCAMDHQGMDDPSTVDRSDLKGSPGDNYLKCGKCRACYAIDIQASSASCTKNSHPPMSPSKPYPVRPSPFVTARSADCSIKNIEHNNGLLTDENRRCAKFRRKYFFCTTSQVDSAARLSCNSD